ncbi:MAG: alkaline phosphatase family protein [Candidatus Aenigmarchaeota archaeon]|nr:alkaline phosphatase family protein [Candidatus Aenigmarchaeota archaeon]
MTKTIAILIDGVNPRQMKAGMPFITAFAKKHCYASIVSMLGYSIGIHPSIWSGKYQDEHGMFTTFYYDPEHSPFTWTRLLKCFPTHFIRKNVLAMMKAPYFLLPGGKMLTPKFIKNRVVPLPPAIPIDVAPYFSNNLPEPKGTLFELLDKKGITYSKQSDSEGYFGEYRTLEDMTLTDSDIDFYYLYRSDELGHIHGPYSVQVMNYLQKADNKIKELLENARRLHSKIHFMLFSDHGMCEVKNFINIQKILSVTKLKNGRDYIAFYDSTMARFWPATEEAKQAIISTLASVKGITFLDSKLLKRYRIDFPDKTRYGELIFLADPETRIFPDYFAPIKGGLKGWHGFDPAFPDSKGVFVTNLLVHKKEIKIIELFKFIKKAAGL